MYLDLIRTEIQLSSLLGEMCRLWIDVSMKLYMYYSIPYGYIYVCTCLITVCKPLLVLVRGREAGSERRGADRTF